MNRALQGRDCGYRGSDPHEASRRGGAMPGPGGLVGGTPDGPATRVQVATGAPQLAQGRAAPGKWPYPANPPPQARKPAAAGTGRAYGQTGDAIWEADSYARRRRA
jgi:hypothetical protein